MKYILLANEIEYLSSDKPLDIMPHDGTGVEKAFHSIFRLAGQSHATIH